MTDYPIAEAPEHLFTDPVMEARWRQRFTASRVSLPEWADDAPNANVYVSNASGVWEIYTWDRATNRHRKITNRPNGTIHATITKDGKEVWWFNDTDGDEFGSWVRQPFSADSGAESPAFSGTHDGYPAGLVLGREVGAVGASTDDGTMIWLAHHGSAIDPWVAEKIYASEHDAGVSALSENERLLAISHSEHGDSRHPALRVLSTADGSTVAEKHDGPGRGLDAVGFAPIPGDSRLLVLHERNGKEELLIWHTDSDTETEIKLDLPGEVVADWYPDGSALLISHTYQARNTLHQLDLKTMRLSTLDTPPGSIGSACARKDGSVEYSWSSAAIPSVVRTLSQDGTDRILLEPPGDKAPHAMPVTDSFVDSPAGRIHALVSRPAQAPGGPLPTVFNVHGGPHSADEDRFSAYRAVWLDAGFVVVEVNYRGSTGYGSAWRDAIEGRPGLTELEDIAAVHDWAVGSGLSDPDKCVINGASWGGYLTLLALGMQPERWAVGVAGVPVADYLAAYEDEMEPLRAFDRALFGGSPDEVHDTYVKCSPLTYVDSVRAPVLVLAGENDPRCPIRQIHNYLERLAARDHRFETYFYDAGHGSLVVAETIKQTAIEVHFARRALRLT